MTIVDMTTVDIKTATPQPPVKKILLVFRQPPYGGSLAREALDVAFAAGIFNQNVSVLFMEDAVWQLVPEQQALLPGSKQHSAMLAALPLYDVEQLYVDAHSLGRLPADAQLVMPCTPLQPAQVRSMLQQHDIVLGF